ncbi:MAG: hypothetical protein H0X27_04465 [Caulobacteraceae bacterium]|nr:hypothetical protein [Caulobacteraceae bacterium]
MGERWGWNQEKGRYLTRAQARHCLDVDAATIEALNQRLPRALPPPLDLDARGFQEREFIPDAAHTPPKELAAFYYELAKTMSQRRGLEAA